jgi:hypothetical protein
MIHDSVRATYDSRETGPRYHVTATVDGRPVSWRHRIPDPFVRQTVRVGWWDLLRGLLCCRSVVVEVMVGGDKEVVDDVLELDGNALVPGRSRRVEFRQAVHLAIADFGRDGMR